MAKIYGDTIEEIAKYLTIKKPIIGHECDVCKTIIPALKYNADENKYYNVMTGHRDWGSQSSDSITYFDICPKCLPKFMSDYFDNNKSDTAYFEAETCHVYPKIKILSNDSVLG